MRCLWPVPRRIAATHDVGERLRYMIGDDVESPAKEIARRLGVI